MAENKPKAMLSYTEKPAQQSVLRNRHVTRAVERVVRGAGQSKVSERSGEKPQNHESR